MDSEMPGKGRISGWMPALVIPALLALAAPAEAAVAQRPDRRVGEA